MEPDRTMGRQAVALKNVKRVLAPTRPHWVGNGFNVYPVFAQLAFSQELSPWLMFDYVRQPRLAWPTTSASRPALSLLVPPRPDF